MIIPTLESALAQAIAKLGCDSGTIHLKQASADVLELVAYKQVPASLVGFVREIPWGKGIAGIAAERGEPVSYYDLQSENTSDIHPRARATGMRGAIVVPMMIGAEVVGTIGIASRYEREFSPSDVEWLMAFGRKLAEDSGEQRLAA